MYELGWALFWVPVIAICIFAFGCLIAAFIVGISDHPVPTLIVTFFVLTFAGLMLMITHDPNPKLSNKEVRGEYCDVEYNLQE